MATQGTGLIDSAENVPEAAAAVTQGSQATPESGSAARCHLYGFGFASMQNVSAI